MLLNKKWSFVTGFISGLAFAPFFLLPCIFSLSFLAAQIRRSRLQKQAFLYSYLFALGMYLSTIYWMAIGVSVYIDKFWWAIPFALFGLPAFISLFYAGVLSFVSRIKNDAIFHLFFCLAWLFTEWLISWIFTGMPWSLLGYIFTFNDIFIQGSSIWGIYGMSLVAVYIGSIFYSKSYIFNRIAISSLMLIALAVYGNARLKNNPTELSELSVRIIQPSIPQTEKWTPEDFWQNLNKQIAMSNQMEENTPDIIFWSEAALTAPYYYPVIRKALRSAFTKEGQVLIAGGVDDNRKEGAECEVYSAMIGLDEQGQKLFTYHKSHLVPFGEYIPFSKYLPLEKITHGAVDYTQGVRKVVYLKHLNLRIHPMICYEAIFADEARIDNSEADLIVNITNDAWYGNSSGPYQHFEISRMRAVENGLPMVRVANNGISAIIDPLGRIMQQVPLNYVNVINDFLPCKLSFSTIYSERGNLMVVFLFITIAACQLMVTKLKVFPKTRKKNL